MDSPRKRGLTDDAVDVARNHGSSTPHSLSRPVSPPLKKRRLPPSVEAKDAKTEVSKKVEEEVPAEAGAQRFRSPFQLTTIRDLPAEMNRDTVTLKDILGDPLIKECWEFNFLHDIDFLMAAFDGDVRGLVKVHVVHGFWRKDDGNRKELEVCLVWSFWGVLVWREADGLDRSKRSGIRMLLFMRRIFPRCLGRITPSSSSFCGMTILRRLSFILPT